MSSQKALNIKGLFPTWWLYKKWLECEGSGMISGLFKCWIYNSMILFEGCTNDQDWCCWRHESLWYHSGGTSCLFLFFHASLVPCSKEVPMPYVTDKRSTIFSITTSWKKTEHLSLDRNLSNCEPINLCCLTQFFLRYLSYQTSKQTNKRLVNIRSKTKELKRCGIPNGYGLQTHGIFPSQEQSLTSRWKVIDLPLHSCFLVENVVSCLIWHTRLVL